MSKARLITGESVEFYFLEAPTATKLTTELAKTVKALERTAQLEKRYPPLFSNTTMHYGEDGHWEMELYVKRQG